MPPASPRRVAPLALRATALALLGAACGPRTTSPPPSMAQVMEYVADGDCAAAEPLLQRLLAEAQGNAAAVHHYLGVCRQAAADLAGAEGHYREALRANPALFEARNNLGVVLGELGRHDESLAVLTELTQAFPEEAEGFYNLGYEQYATGDKEGAVASFRRAGELDTCRADTLVLAAAALLELQRRDEALVALREAVRRQPDDALVALGAARGFADAGVPDEAVPALVAAAASPGNAADLVTNVALELRSLGRPAEALAAARAAVDRAAGDEELRRATLAFCLVAREAGRSAETEPVLRAALARLPEDPLLNFYLGGVLVEAGRCAEAAPLLKKAAQPSAGPGLSESQSAEARRALAACGAEP
jgi:Tfp pilus assembly protein PilF